MSIFIVDLPIQKSWIFPFFVCWPGRVPIRCRIAPAEELELEEWNDRIGNHYFQISQVTRMGMDQKTLVPCREPLKIAGLKWMFIPLKMDDSRYWSIPNWDFWGFLWWCAGLNYVMTLYIYIYMLYYVRGIWARSIMLTCQSLTHNYVSSCTWYLNGRPKIFGTLTSLQVQLTFQFQSCLA